MVIIYYCLSEMVALFRDIQSSALTD